MNWKRKEITELDPGSVYSVGERGIRESELNGVIQKPSVTT